MPPIEPNTDERRITPSSPSSPPGAAALRTALLALALAGCGDFGSSAASGDFGATPGGVQDMSLARELIAAGNVPSPEAFVVEGMFSEHELGLEGTPCRTLLCLRSAVAVAPDLSGEPAAWLQVGMSSTVTPGTFRRPALDVVAVVDVSGSMGWNYRPGDDEAVTPGKLTRQLLHALTERLDSQDHLAIVTYGSDVETRLDFTRGDQQSTITRVIDDLGTAGSTNMEAGMRLGYQLARDAAERTGRTAEQTRVIVFTDVQPNVGATSASEFETLAARGADDGIGLTVMGMGLGMGQEILLAMSHLRGGNAFGFTRPLHVDKFVDDDWPFFVSPIAYDLSMAVTTGDDVTVAAAHGFPGGSDDGGQTGGEGITPALDVATVFLSRRKGALLVRLDAPVTGPENQLAPFAATIDLSYREIAGETREQTLEARYDGEALDLRGHFYQQAGAGKTVALALLVTGMRDAAELYGSNPAAAIEHMRAVHERVAADAESLADDALTPEVTLAADLLALMESGADQGNFFP